MKTLFLILTLIGIQLVSFGQKIKISDPKIFTESFILAVKSHDTELTIKHLDKPYVDEQLKRFLKNNKKQFLDELFSGQVVDSDDWFAIPFDEILELTIVDIVQEESNGWVVNFQLTSTQYVIYCNLWLRETKKDKKSKLGFQGSFG